MGPFETERLTLRTMEAADVPVLRELIYSDREVWGQYSGYGDKTALLEKAFANQVNQPDDAELTGWPGFRASTLDAVPSAAPTGILSTSVAGAVL